MTKNDWFRYYSRENKVLLDLIRHIRYGQLSLEVHECHPVKIHFGKAFRLNVEKDLNELEKIFNNTTTVKE